MDEEKTMYETEGDQPNFVLVQEEEKDELSNDPEERCDNDHAARDVPASTPEQHLKRKGRFNFKRFMAVLLIAALSASAGFAGGIAAIQYKAADYISEGTRNQITINPTDNVNIGEAVAAKVIPSVVGISTTQEVIRQNIFGMQQGQLIQGVGT